MENAPCKSEKIMCIIPARGGSKGVIKKNVRLLGGKPLIKWTIDEAKKSKFIDNIFVSTEDPEIAQISRDFGAEVIDRPVELAGDSSATIDALLYTLDKLKEYGIKAEYTLLLQCTSPFRKMVHIDEAIQKFLSSIETADSLISVTKVEHPPWWYFKLTPSGYISEFLEYDKNIYVNRQDFPEVYNANGAIFIAKTEILYKHKRFETGKTLAYVMDSNSSIDIDNETDFMLAEFLVNTKK